MVLSLRKITLEIIVTCSSPAARQGFSFAPAMLAAISRIDKPYKILSLSLSLAESGDTEEPGWFSLSDGSRHGGIKLFE